jgi:hypothetical protein
MKKLLLVFCAAVLLCGVSTTSQAQQKDWAIGIRLGEPAGLNVKKYIGKSNALDINIGAYGNFYGQRAYKDGYWRKGAAVMVNYLWQKQIPGAKGLQWYYGLGGQVGFRKYYWWDKSRYNYEYYAEETRVSLGITGMIGLEWFIPKAPISLFVDATPYIEIVPSVFGINFQGGIGGRLNF